MPSTLYASHKPPRPFPYHPCPEEKKMKKLRSTALVLAVLLILSLTSCALAMSPGDYDSRFIRDVQNRLASYVSWTRNVQDDGTFLHITEDGYVNGHACNFTVIGYHDRAYQICLTVPFQPLLPDYGSETLPDELILYDAVLSLVLGEIPKNASPQEMFLVYDIHYALETGWSDKWEPLPDGWEWVRKEPGYLWMKRREYPSTWSLSAHRLDTGDVWFNFEIKTK